MQLKIQVKNYKLDMSIKELQEKNLGARRNFHDDITIIVIDL